jgi:hypothetical protein
MHEEPLDGVALWVLFVVGLICWSLALESGYRLGRRRHAQGSGEKESPVGTMVGSILGLFAFMLAFTFSLAATQFEARRQAVLDEANAIGTTYLRARLLPEPYRAESLQLLRAYLAVRVRVSREGTVQEARAQSEELHERLWVLAIKAAEERPNPITAIYLAALNQMIDMHGVRIQVGLRNHIPTVIWVGLFALALLSMCSVGYQAGLSGTRRSPAMIVLVLGFASVMFLIADLSRPQEGFLTVGQQAILDLQSAMQTEKPSP